ncbi:MAG: HPr family phosphocarrier protein [Ndongobacter sp.]|nr:HPr family phosphocarrier protein [Ndongobacter sp.]
MIEKRVKLVNEVGLHARPASIFIMEAVKFVSDIFVEKDDKIYNAKSIMSILSMGASKGETITIRAEGEDAQEAVDTLAELVQTKLGEY